MRPVVDESGQKLCGPGRFHPGGVLKSAMQRLEQGDVVTGAQFARQGYSSPFFFRQQN
ncbi:TPA: hypothetical protein ACF63N_001895 [Salmonella enterica]|uniref:Uncharacterized protein n=2 Tax=Enterobacteriaceae TaxID=543 RepID=A0A6C8EXR3_SALV4|nr:hypothetical protein FORC80_2003 [Salmonella enterica subsp. enterica serovar Virchow]EDZ00735.1 hypothetical protein SeV_A0270 [Salmonella enterica subsp. enterica serovar Virchow str. SL491]EGG8413574.1 hypothetical protein [Salmonella enterica]ESE95253.1 hypothetical protein SEEV1955_21923 [Salmonella enterica subsp. enterica serovar Virchow str. ATCC 51955]EEN7249846.1 hypothetical protein [Salmonella enterica subsp. enterica serovar Virchow]